MHLFLFVMIMHLIKVVYGEDEIAYQIGETTAILSRGYLCATPHCVRVRKFCSSWLLLSESSFWIFLLKIDIWFLVCLFKAPHGEEARGLERSTFALFMQPDWYYSL